MPPTQQYICPSCSNTVEAAPASVDEQWTCPHCGNPFVVGPTEGAEGAESEATPTEDRDDELDGMRIRQLSHARRAAYRSRSFCLVGALFCAVGAVQLTINLATSVVRGQNDWTTGVYVIVDALMLWGMLHLLRKARQLNAEARRSSLSPPDEPPDFSTLSDGSQRWKDLENLR